MANEDTNTLKEYAEKWAEAKKAEVKACPSCGRCQTCGRGGHQAVPWVVPMPSYPWHYYRPYHQPYQVWCGTEASGTGAITNAPHVSMTYTGH